MFNSANEATFHSDIFTYDDLEHAKNLHVSLKGVNWPAKEVTEEDIPFMQDLFNNPVVMRGFADGQVRSIESTEERVRKSWIFRFKDDQPHGGLTVFKPEVQVRMGLVVAGGGDEDGVSELAYAYIPENWGKKLV